jgi:UDP-N-acetylglucosamine 4,6-dehydratase (inverting)
MDLAGKTILLTGGTGSFGHAFVERILTQHPETTLRVFSRDELKQSEMQALYRGHEDQLRFFVGDVRNRSRLTRAMKGVDLVVHAAAMKQVPACEYNPFEAVQTNVLGAQHIVDAAIDTGVDQVVALSTDKAVNPVNLYGATKLCEEKIIIQGNAYAAGFDTRLSCVRYGNVVGSRGSVVPLFRRQIAEGRLTITDERMSRFWITLPQAVDLVEYAIEHSVGGEIFIPKIPSMKVVDLAAAMAPGVPVEIIGIRPGEKLHEVLITDDESRHTIDAGDVYVVLPEHPWWTDHPKWVSGKPLPDGFIYASHTNDEWLGPDELAGVLDA